MSSRRRDPPDHVPKRTLFCPECEYEACLEGGWDESASAGVTQYRCPECGAVVARRPTPGGSNRPSPE